MVSNKLTRFFFQKLTSRKFHSITNEATPAEVNPGALRDSNLSTSLKKKLKTYTPKERNTVCIYKVPANMRQVEPKAYEPNIISIGPYHHQAKHLKEMEELKWRFFHRLFDTSQPNCGVNLDPVINAMKEMEQGARSCYRETFEPISSDEFVEMMLIDGCFIIGFFRELKKNNFTHGDSIEGWMLPTLRRDLIMLENQLPLSVLQRLFDLTSNGTKEESTSLQELVLHFFNPLLQRESNTAVQDIIKEGIEGKHFLDLFRSSIIPKAASDRDSNSASGVETDMMRSVTELNEAGVIIEKAKNCKPLAVQSEGRVLKIPPLYIDDYKGTLFRNMVAFEQCHRECKSHITSFLFFFDGLINAAEDVELLHYKEVIHHSLGNNKEVAKLVNNLCKEIARDAEESYLKGVVWDANFYFDTWYAKIRARLVHHYFSSWVVGISTLAAIIALYLTLIQTGCGVADALEKLTGKHFAFHLIDSILLPFFGPSSSTSNSTNSGDESKGEVVW